MLRRFFICGVDSVVVVFQTIKTTLEQCYGDKSAVTDELVDAILKPGLEPGAAEVFLVTASRVAVLHASTTYTHILSYTCHACKLQTPPRPVCIDRALSCQCYAM